MTNPSQRVRWLEGRRGDEFIAVTSSKPPRLRYRPGNMIHLEGELYEIIFAHRLEEDPHEWRFVLEERTSVLASDPRIEGDIERVVYEVFESQSDAYLYYSNWPARGRQRIVTNKMMVQGAKLVSSGEVLPPGEMLTPEELASIPLLEAGE